MRFTSWAAFAALVLCLCNCSLVTGTDDLFGTRSDAGNTEDAAKPGDGSTEPDGARRDTGTRDVNTSDGGGSDDASPSDGSSDAGPAYALEDVPDLYARIVCDLLRTCVAETGPAKDLYAMMIDLDACETNFAEELRNGELPAWLDAQARGKMVFHAEKVDACLAAVRAISCGELGTMRTPAACNDVVEGLVSSGGNCLDDVDCADDLFCDFSAPICPDGIGTCATPRPETDVCYDDDECGAGLKCYWPQGGAPHGTCGPVGAEDDACGEDAECRFGLLCAYASDASDPPTCRTPDQVFSIATGQPCNKDLMQLCNPPALCVYRRFTGGWICEYPVGGGCVPAIPEMCPAGEYCPSGPGGGPTCIRLPGEGSPCANGYDGRCASGLKCVNGTCVLPAANGAVCTPYDGNDDECYSGYCDWTDGTGTCAPWSYVCMT